jgi:dihydroorotase
MFSKVENGIVWHPMLIASFIETTLVKVMNRFPKLRIVLEHISTQEAVWFVKESGESGGFFKGKIFK